MTLSDPIHKLITKVETLVSQSYEILDQNPDKGLEYAQQAHDLSRMTEYNQGIEMTTLRIVQAYYFKGELERSILIAKDFLSEKDAYHDQNTQGELLRYVSACYNTLNKTDDALIYAKRSLACYETTENFVGIGKALNVLGNIYHQQNDYAEALLCYQESLEYKKKLYEEKKDIRLLDTVATGIENIAIVYHTLDDYKKALEVVQEAHEYIKISGNQHHLARNYQTEGIILADLDRLPEAREKFNNALLISEQNDYKIIIAACYAYLSDIYFNEDGDYIEGLRLAEKGFEIAKKLNLHNYIYFRCLKSICIGYRKVQRYDEVLQYGQEGISFAERLGVYEGCEDILTEMLEVYKALGDYPKALAISEKKHYIQQLLFNAKSDSRILKFRAKLELSRKEQELGYQKQLLLQEEQLNQRLIRINEELDRFVSIAAHDLKAPIRTVYSFGKLLMRKIESEEQQEFLQYILRAGEQMQQLLEDLLAFARAGGVHANDSERLDLNDIIGTVLNNMRAVIKQTKADISYTNLPSIIGHSTPITQLFQNIISNAIKYQAENVKPKIYISYQLRDNAYEIQISDNGIGIEEQYLENIFLPFTRLHQYTKYKGSGIGLTTCKRLMEQYGGEIWATSRIGEGSIFHILFPKRKF